METQAETTTHNTGIDEEGKEMYDGGRERKRREGRGGENQRGGRERGRYSRHSRRFLLLLSEFKLYFWSPFELNRPKKTCLYRWSIHADLK